MRTDPIVLSTLQSALRVFKEFTGDGDCNVPCLETFLCVATLSEPSIDDVSKAIGLTQATASRNVKKMAVGPLQQPGYALITIDLDRVDQRRRILALSDRGRELVRLIQAATMPKLKRHFVMKTTEMTGDADA